MSPLPVGQSGNATCRVRNELNSHSPESRGVDCRRGGSVLIRFVVADRRYDNRCIVGAWAEIKVADTSFYSS